jgi:roadblock/LC7 domain-containing protein
MSTITDSDLQQLKDLITAGQLATQQQIAELKGDIREVKAELGGKIDTTNAEIKGIHNELANIRSDQKAQDTRFWSLVFLILTTSIGAIGKLAKFY